MLSILIVLLLVALGAYFILMSRAADSLAPFKQRWHLAGFIVGLFAAMIVFIPSPDLFGPEHRFTVSMGQMLLAGDVGPLLIFIGIPAVTLERFNAADRLTNALAKPLLVFSVSSLILLFWFVPVVFETASRSLPLWILKQIMCLFAGFLFWWPVASPMTAWKPSQPIQLLYLFLGRLPMTLLGILFTFADQIIYASRSFALEICAPSSLSDQQVGGLVVWTVGGMIVFIAFTVVFFRWFDSADRPNP